MSISEGGFTEDYSEGSGAEIGYLKISNSQPFLGGPHYVKALR